MVQQINIQQISQQQSTPKKQNKAEKSSFETALEKATDKLRPQTKKNEGKAEKTDSSAKVAAEDIQPVENQQAEELLGALQGLPVVLWLPTDPAEIAAPAQAESANLLSSVSSLAVSAQTILPGQEDSVLTMGQPAVQAQTAKQLQSSQPINFAASLQAETQQTAQQVMEPAEPVSTSQVTAFSNLAQPAEIVQNIPQTVPQNQGVSVKTTREQFSAVTAENQNSASVVPTAVQGQAQPQESTLHTAADTTASTQSEDGKSGSSEQSSDFAAMFVGQQSSLSSASVKTAAHALSAGTVSHLTEQIAKNAQAGQNQFRMELFPQDLGRISVSLKMEQGLLVVDILADSPKTQSLLASSSGEIRSMLESAVGQPVQIAQAAQDAPAYYQQEQESSQQQQQQSGQHENQQEEQQSTQDFLSVLQQLKIQGGSL